MFSLILIIFLALFSNTFASNGLKPNFVIILADDLDICMNSLTPLQKTRSLISDNGATFTNFFATTPVCCPSRATILTGQYPHNTKTTNNSVEGGCYGSHWKSKVEPGETLAVYLKEEGYKNFYGGKYLNEYHTSSVPKGYDDFIGLQGNSKYYNYSLNINGKIEHFTDTYLTDLLTQYATQFIKSISLEPFLMIIAPPAPHQPFDAAEKYKNEFLNEKVPRQVNFNSGASGKHWLMNLRPELLNSNEVSKIDEFHRKRWQTLLSVDDLVESVVHSLIQKGILENTFIFFTSDHGFHLGQFSQPFDKRQPYECDVRIPFLVRGPGVQPKSVIHDLGALVDLAPTILDIAGISNDKLDGISLHSALIGEENRKKRENLLIEYFGEGDDKTYDSNCPWTKEDHLNLCQPAFDCRCNDARNNTFSCIRNIDADFDYLYCEFKDSEHFVEMYNHVDDPYQMENIGYSELPAIRANFMLRLEKLKNCKGNECFL